MTPSSPLPLRLAVLTPVLLMLACTQDPQLGPGSEIVLSPQARHIQVRERIDENGHCQFDEQQYQDTPLQIVVTSATGSAVSGVDLSVYVDYAQNTYPGPSALALYADANGNGVVDAADELVSGIDDDIHTTTTEDYTGASMLLLRINLSCAFKGSVFVFSGPLHAAMEITVQAHTEEE